MSERAEQVAFPVASEAIAKPSLHHVNLKTTRLQEMIDWYGTVVGMEVVHEFAGGAFLTNDAACHRLALLTSPAISKDEDKLRHAGIHHIAFEYDSVDELMATYKRLRSKGIGPHCALDHGMTLSLYYVDPDGNSVELQVDNFGDWTKSTEFMRAAPEFEADPIGALVDPDQLLEAHEAGVVFEELHRRAYAGEFPSSKPMDLRFPVE